MSLGVAFQSVVFYVMACTPCMQVRSRHKSKVQARNEREAKAKVLADQPNRYHHPDPFNTNPYWGEEIRMGPSLPRKEKGRNGRNGKNKSSSQQGLANPSRDLTSIELESSVSASEPAHQPYATRETVVPTPTIHPSLASSPTMVPDDDTASAVLSKTASVSTGDDWNRKLYQREDEELWGHDLSRTGQKLMDAIKQAGSTAGRFVESKLGIEKSVTDEDRHNFYFAPKNPPVNDYHPPVVRSKPARVDGLHWMLQPPPPAKVMEGKVPVSRTASMMSVGSRRTVGTTEGMSMGRRLGEKALEAKLRNGEHPHDDRDPHSTTSLPRTRPRRGTVSSTRTRSRPTTGHYTSTEDDDSDTELYRRRTRRQSRRAIPAFQKDSDSDENMEPTNNVSYTDTIHAAHSAHVAQKPRLPTILSSESTTQEVKPLKTIPSTKPLQEVTNKPAPIETNKAPSEDALSSSLDSGVGLHLR